MVQMSERREVGEEVNERNRPGTGGPAVSLAGTAGLDCDGEARQAGREGTKVF